MRHLALLMALITCQLASTGQLSAQEAAGKKSDTPNQPSWEELENTWICYRFGGFSIKRITKGKETYEQYWAGGKLRFSNKADMTLFRQAGINFYTKTNQLPINPETQPGISNDYTGMYKVINGQFYEFNRGLFANHPATPQITVFRPITAPIEKWLAAARKGDIKTIEAMLADGANPDATAPGSVTALNFAACQGHIELIKLLVNNKAQVSARSGHLGAPALVSAAGAGQLESCKTLLSLGADIQQSHLWFNMSPLHETAFQGQPKVMKFLISKGADLNALNKGGWTPLHVVVSRSADQKGELRAPQVECLRLLLKHGAKKGAKDPKGKTPLDVAKELNLSEIIKILTQ